MSKNYFSIISIAKRKHEKLVSWTEMHDERELLHPVKVVNNKGIAKKIFKKNNSANDHELGKGVALVW